MYGARSVMLSGSPLATQSIAPTTLRQALLGKVLTVGDAVSLLPATSAGTSTSAATRALASAVGISWTSELLTVTGVEPAGPVSVQPNSSVTWGTGVPEAAPEPTARRVAVDDLKGVHPQVAKLTEWLKLALDEPHLLQTLGASPHLGVLVSGPAGVGKATLVRAVCAGRRLVELDGPEIGALAGDDRLKAVTTATATVRDGGGVLLITDVDALLPATAEPVATLILAELRALVATSGVAFVATSAVPDRLDTRLRAPTCVTGNSWCRCPTQPPAPHSWLPCCGRCRHVTLILTKLPAAHRDSSSPTWLHWCVRRRCGQRREPAPTENRRP
ncbi:ATPase associated with various cellular activities family protein [Mycobacterium xenopi 4042]|uniref:ATPase associated with various cellular activities family protein n=1 Tax=Mycobacterium xenopi 4042 TaxID=1299334 RepID=X8DL50_MYCXE|nr:ATPase associated with various cellular activities family protein [Mycobacterium xenopi 4042]